MAIRTALGLSVLFACAHSAPHDTSIEATFPPAGRGRAAAASGLPGGHGSTLMADRRGDRGADQEGSRAPATPDLIVLEEVHGHKGCSTACEVAQALGFQSVYEPEFAIRDGSDGVAIVRARTIDSAGDPLPYYNVHFNDELRRRGACRHGAASTARRSRSTPSLTNRLTVDQRRRQMMPVLNHAAKQHTPVIIRRRLQHEPFHVIAHTIRSRPARRTIASRSSCRSHGFATPVASSGSTHRYFWMKLRRHLHARLRDPRVRRPRTPQGSDHRALWAQVTALK